IILAVVGCVVLSRAFAKYRVPNVQDLTVCSVFNVNAGESIEEDFFIPKTDWRLNRLLDRPDIETVLRILIDADMEDAHLYINGKDMGTLSSLLVKKSDGIFFNTFPVYDCIVKFPKEILRGSDKVTIRITAGDGFSMAYSSGIHPFPAVSHSRLIAPDGTAEDLSGRYYNRRFRFQNAIYLISNKYYTKEKYPMVFGAIL
ncbi:MAG: hypothetical protein PHN63_04260, partial [Candidatus Omnitrophica bacterium]|nr:hypothetical protein [Candidatus Omnitrophota bacterium]